MRRTRVICGAATAVVLAAPGAGHAQSAQAPSSATTLSEVTVTGAKRNALQLDAVSTTGSRLGLTPLETPASIQVIPGDLIRRHGDVDILQAQQRAAGITAVPTPGDGGTALVARGFSGPNSVKQIYDGLQLFVGSGTVTFPFDTWTVDRIEVLSGPSSVLFGTGAIGATVNVVPRSPDPAHPGGEVQVGGGSFGTFRAAVDATGALTDKLSYRVDVSGVRSDGWIDRGDSSSTAVSASLRYDATPDLVFILSDDFGDINPMQYYGAPVVGDAPPKALRKLNYNVLDAQMRFQDNFAQFKTEWTPLQGLKLRNTLYALTTDRRWRNEENFAYDPSTNLVVRDGYLRIKHFQQQFGDHLDLAWSGKVLGLQNDLSFGGEVNSVRFQNNSNNPFPGVSTVPVTNFDPGLFILAAPVSPVIETHTDARAAFLEDRITPAPGVSIVGGVRYDRYELERIARRTATTTFKTFDTVSWRLGGVYEPRPGLSLYVQYAKATDPVGSLISLSPAQQIFDLTTGRQYEAGIKAVFLGGRGQATLAGYDIVKNNLVAPIPGRPTESQQIGRQSSRGVEAQLSLDVGHGVTIEANGTLLNAEFKDFGEVVGGVLVNRAGNRPPDVPERAANAFLTWRATERLELRGGLRYVGDRFISNDNVQVLPEYVTVDLGARFQITPRVFADLRVYNANDAFYAQSGYNGTQWILGRPRAVELVLNGRF